MSCTLPSGKRYVAYVEDDEEDVELFAEAAGAAELLVISFPSGRELLQCLNMAKTEDLPCLILLDLQNPVITGPETYACLQAEDRFREIPVLYFSNSSEMMGRASEVGLITKPDIFSEWIRLMDRLKEYCREDVAGNLA